MNDPVLLQGLAAEFERHDPIPAAVRDAAERAGSLVPQAQAWTPLSLVAGDGVRGDVGLLGFACRTARVDLEIESDRTVRLMPVVTYVRRRRLS